MGIRIVEKKKPKEYKNPPTTEGRDMKKHLDTVLPKYPQTRMQSYELTTAFDVNKMLIVALGDVANAAIARAIEDGDVKITEAEKYSSAGTVATQIDGYTHGETELRLIALQAAVQANFGHRKETVDAAEAYLKFLMGDTAK